MLNKGRTLIYDCHLKINWVFLKVLKNILMKVYVKVSILRSHNHGFCTAYLRLKPFFVLLIQVLKKWVKFLCPHYDISLLTSLP